MRLCRFWSILWLICAVLCSNATRKADAAPPPNIVLVLADDMGWRDPGFMGSDFHRTPNLDRLAAEGLTFHHAYANAPVCAATRAALLSGMYAVRTGVYTVGGGRRPSMPQRLITPQNARSLDPDIVTFPELLQAAGYATGHFGKWHLGRPDGPDGPRACGFDVSVGAARGGATRTYFAPYGLADLEDAPEGEYLTHRLTDEAIAFIQANADRPFFAYISHYAVHTPIEVEPSVLAAVKTRPAGTMHSHAAYAAMIESLDSSVGRLLAALEDEGVARNTVVVFASDNGGSRRTTRMDPLKGYKGSLNEGGIRVPCVVRYPGVVAPGRRCDAPVMLFDLYPTLIELSNGALPQRQPVDGRSWGPILRGADDFAQPRNLFWYLPVYVTNPRGRTTTEPSAVIRRGQWKLTYYFEDRHIELYDLEDDPGEVRDLAEAEPAVADALLGEIKNWQKATEAPVPNVNPAYRGDTRSTKLERKTRQ